MRPEPHPSSLLIVGGTKAGKTHYGGQLLRRLQRKKHRLRILGAPSDLTPFQEVLDRLAQGRSAPHTPTPFYRESIWNVGSEDQSYDSQLVWPDYGGEQVEDIVKRRQVSELWVKRIRESTGWLFFVRLHMISKAEDILDRPRGLDRMQSGNASEQIEGTSGQERTGRVEAPELAASALPSGLNLSTQAGLVELLQALLFVKQVGSNVQLRRPSLVVVLSCWDEIAKTNGKKATEDPTAVLKDRLPLLSQFIESTWQQGRADVIGLSSLGKALNDEVSDEGFMDNGPERQGWCVLKDGKRSEDLTLPVTMLIDKARHEG